MKLRIWCNYSFGPTALRLLHEQTSGHHLTLATEGTAGLEGADVALGQPDATVAMQSTRLRWIHITSAGYTSYDCEDFRAALRARGAILTNSSSVFDEPCAEHVLAMMLALARQLPQALKAQCGARDWISRPLRARSQLLRGQTVLLLGFGAIGRRLAELLAPFHATVYAVKRNARERSDLAQIVDAAELPRLLLLADHVVNMLPLNDSTEGFMTAERFAQMKRGARFYNIGRGATVVQDALLAALESGQVGAAYLDVMMPEPLPKDHALWNAPNCLLTPHIAGGHHDEDERLVRHFLGNLGAFESGRPLKDRVI